MDVTLPDEYGAQLHFDFGSRLPDLILSSGEAATGVPIRAPPSKILYTGRFEASGHQRKKK
jgi:hypothetical protein